MSTWENALPERGLVGRCADRLRERLAELGADGPAWNGLAKLLFVVATVLVLLTFRDYGVTWDEDVHNWYGVFVLDYYLSLFRDLKALNWLNLYNYGAAFDMIAAALNTISPIGTYETRHLLNGLVGVLGIVGCWKLGRALGGPRAGFLAALFLLLIPNYYGQMYNNPKDIPFAVAGTWSLYYMVRATPLLPRVPLRLVAKLAVSIGLALGVRVGGLLFLCYLGLLGTLFLAWRAAETRDWRAVLGDLGVGSARVLLPTVLIAYAVMLVFWPWAQVAPIEHPLRSLEFFSHETFPFKTLFDGRYFPATDLPWAYLPTYIALALPELVLLLLAAAPLYAAVAFWRRPAARRRDIVLTRFMLGFAIVFPVAYAAAIKAVLFDGMRHFIFVLPPIACAAALVADRMFRRLRRARWRGWIYGALALYGAAHVSIMVMLHPDQYVYYNGFIGGVEGAAGLFKLDYWANSYAEAVGALEDHLRAEYGADFMDHDFTVAACGPPVSAAYYFPSNFIFTANPENAEFFIAFTKDKCNKALPGKEIYRVERMGTLLSVVLDRRGILAQARDNRPLGSD